MTSGTLRSVALFVVLVAHFVAARTDGLSVPKGFRVDKVGSTKQDSESFRKRPVSSRVIVRYGAAMTQGGARRLLAHKTQVMQAMPGVQWAETLGSLGMAVVQCESLEAQEAVYQELAKDPDVELAVPDSLVHALGGHLRGSALPQEVVKAADQARTPQVAFVTTQGQYLAVGKHWALLSDPEKNSQPNESSIFQLFFNEASRTYSLKSSGGKFLAVNKVGDVYATEDVAGPWEQFRLHFNSDSSVSLQAWQKTFVAIQTTGGLNANGELNTSTHFHMINIGSAQQRFPDDPLMTRLWGLHQYNGHDIGAVEAWNNFTGEFADPVVVAVIDTGIDYNHVELSTQMWANTKEIPENGIDDDGNGFVDDFFGVNFFAKDADPMDDQYHGTHCSGTISGAGNNGVGVAGVAWRGVRLMALKFLDSDGSGTASDSVRAIDYAVTNGARVISASWGGSASNSAMKSAIDRASAAGVLFVVAAGNEAANNDEIPSYPACYNSTNIISVAAINQTGDLADFSNWGSQSVHVAAPGVDIVSTAPGDQYAMLDGTSMATPHVSGLAALVWLYRPSLTFQQVKDVIVRSVSTSPKLQGQIISGGVISASGALEALRKEFAPRGPKTGALSVEFVDQDPALGGIAGHVTINVPANQLDVEFYKVYFASEEGYLLASLGSIRASGHATSLKLKLEGHYGIPRGARHLIALAGNATGQQSARSSAIPKVLLQDYVRPEAGPANVSWESEVTPFGAVVGKLAVVRASTERTITHYNVYWNNATDSGEPSLARTRGPLLTQIPSKGFRAPTCIGSACELLLTNFNGTGYRFERSNYTNNEIARLSFTGPAIVNLTFCQTEEGFDVLKIGKYSVSGDYTNSMNGYLVIPLGAGPQVIQWRSDQSATGSGWSFDLVQQDAVDVIQFPPMGRLASHLEVVSAYNSVEGTESLLVSTEMNTPKLFSSLPAFVVVDDLPESLDQPSGVQIVEKKMPWIQRQADKGEVVWQTEHLEASSASSSRLLDPRVQFAVQLRGLVNGGSELAGDDDRLRRLVIAALESSLVSLGAAIHVEEKPRLEIQRVRQAAAGTRIELLARTSSPSESSLETLEAHLLLLQNGGPAAVRLGKSLKTRLAQHGVSFADEGLAMEVLSPQILGGGVTVVP